MIIGIGIDIIEIDRFQQVIARRGESFLKKLFTDRECGRMTEGEDQTPHTIAHFAARFSAKESVTKALGTGFRGIDWHDIEILNNTLGKPEVFLSEKLNIRFDNPELLITISHSKTQACAFCLWQKS